MITTLSEQSQNRGVCWNNTLLHNVAEILPTNDGLRLLRVPDSVRVQLNERAQIRPFEPWGVELQCVVNSGQLLLEVSSAGQSRASVHHGDFLDPKTWIFGRERCLLTVESHERMKLVRDAGSDWDFLPQVARVAFHGDPIRLHRIESPDHRPPLNSEVPTQRLIAYGTSITCGVGSSFPHLSYAKRIAQAWGVQLINVGIRGSAHCDPAMADYIAERDDWQAGLLELSVNMLNIFTPREFEMRLRKFIGRLVSCRKPLVCISLLPHFRDLSQTSIAVAPYRESLRHIIEDLSDPAVTFVDGTRLMSLTGLSSDLLHPSDVGHAEIARNFLRLVPRNKLFP